MIRLGLCCTFRDEPIKFVNTTAAAAGRMARAAALEKLSDLCIANAVALQAALEFCVKSGIGCFRVNSQILPLKTHPAWGYAVEALPRGAVIERAFRECGAFAREHDVRTCFHPDQFVVLNSHKPEVVTASVRELEYQAEVAEWIGADVLNIHGGGAFGDKAAALVAFEKALDLLSPRARSRVTVENDDKLFTPADLLPVCLRAGIPLVYDVHHHRCNADGRTIEETTREAVKTWNREPLFHLSSPLDGWEGKQPARHHDFIDITDFPACWRGMDVTVEIEAKGKEAAVLKLARELAEEEKLKAGRGKGTVRKTL